MKSVDPLTEELLRQMRKYPEVLQTTAEWHLSMPRQINSTLAKVRSRLEKLEKDGVIEKVVHTSPNSGKVTAIFWKKTANSRMKCNT